MKPLRILIGSNIHWWNAEAAYAAELALHLQQAGHQVWVLTCPDTPNAKQLQARGLSLITDINLNTPNPLKLRKAFQQLKQWMTDNPVDVVNVHQSKGLLAMVLLKRQGFGFRLIRTRGTVRPVQTNWANRWISTQQIDAHIFAGKAIRDDFLKRISLPEESCHTIYYPMPLPKSSDAQQAPIDYFKEWDIPKTHRVLAIVGRLGRVKGHHLLLHCFAELLEEHPDTTLLVLHKHADPAWHELGFLQDYVVQLGIERSVRFIGPRDDLPSIMRFVDLGVIASIDSEVICRVAMEFFAQSTPIVALPTGCLPEIILENTGWLVPEPTSAALTATLKSLFDKHGLLWDVKKRTFLAAQPHFSPQSFLEKTLKVFL